MRIPAALLFAFLSLLPTATNAQQTTYRIGNSLTWDSQPKSIEQLAAQRRLEHRQGYHINCGKSLQRIWTYPDETCVTPVEGFGKFRDALTKHTWSAVAMQPYPGTGSTLATDAVRIVDFIDLTRENPENAATVFYIYAAWPRRTERTYQEVWHQTVADEDSTNTVLAADYFDHLFSRVCRKTGADVRMIPVGHVLAEIDRRMRAGEVPGFTNIHQWYRDDHHLTVDLGRYVAGITTFCVLFAQDPHGMTKPMDHYGSAEAFSPELVEVIHDATWRTVTELSVKTRVKDTAASSSLNVR